MKIELVKAVEALIQAMPGALNIKNGKTPPKLLPKQDSIESELTTSKYMIPVLSSGKAAVIAVQFVYDKRKDCGYINMSDTTVGLLVDRSNGMKFTAQGLYRVLREGDKRLSAEIECYKCGHKIEHECW